jgi:hypothetical protein
MFMFTKLPHWVIFYTLKHYNEETLQYIGEDLKNFMVKWYSYKCGTDLAN